MTKLEKDLHSIAGSIYRFYGTLTATIVALPLLDRALGLLPPVLGQRTTASVAGTIVAIALIGYDYLRSKEAGTDARLPIGAGYVLVGVLLTIAYVGVAELIQQQRLPVSAALDAVFIVWYVILYSVFALGMCK
jgi:hypothetical protein